MSQENVEKLRAAYELVNNEFEALKRGELRGNGQTTQSSRAALAAQSVPIAEPFTRHRYPTARARNVLAMPRQGLRDGKVVHSTHHWEKAQALEAAGLRE